MPKILTFTIDSLKRKTLFFATNRNADISSTELEKTAAMMEIEKKGNCLFYQETNSPFLVKFQRSRYQPRKHLLKWFYRDVLNSRLLLRNYAKREYCSNRKLASLGFKVLDTKGWGVNLSVTSLEVSYLYLEYLPGAPNLHEAKSLYNYEAIIKQWITLMALLYTKGYYMQDPHPGNFLYHNNEVYFIDTEIKKLPSNTKRKQKKFDKFIQQIKELPVTGNQKLIEHFSNTFSSAE